MSLEEGRAEAAAATLMESTAAMTLPETIKRAVQAGYAERVEDELRDKIADVLYSGIGFGVSLLGKLHVHTLENGNYEVTEDVDVGQPGGERNVSLGVYGSSQAAVAVLLRRRHELKLGFDYEKEPR